MAASRHPALLRPLHILRVSGETLYEGDPFFSELVADENLKKDIEAIIQQDAETRRFRASLSAIGGNSSVASASLPKITPVANEESTLKENTNA
ncbi:unnamed protein product, partial [Amoebophrya sp. A25]|eukprot:GSA25T00000734001.1